ncbi:DUF6702 family protein [Arsenicibacter rosenii]|nr:DUF6702 family protein [Arsenicibacter rosenii]
MYTFINSLFRQFRRTVSLLSVSFLFLGNRQAHDFHTSITQMTYNAKDKAFEISVRVFTDDFEKALTKENNGQKIHLADNDKNDPLIEKYIRKHIHFSTGQNQRKAYSYIGHETEADAQWLYLEMPFAEPFKGGQMQQDVLMELFDDQVNLVNLQYQNQKKTFIFRSKQPSQEINF